MCELIEDGNFFSVSLRAPADQSDRFYKKLWRLKILAYNSQCNTVNSHFRELTQFSAALYKAAKNRALEELFRTSEERCVYVVYTF
jgi:hypothetical protein